TVLRRGSLWKREAEIVARVEEAEVLDEPADEAEIGRKQAALDLGPEEPAQQATEVLVARVREEAPRVGEHPDEAREEPHVRERVDLPAHPVELIEEPPRAAVLELPRNRAVLEVADNRGEELVVARVQVVEDRLREAAGRVEPIEEPCERPRHLEVADRVGAGIEPDLP